MEGQFRKPKKPQPKAIILRRNVRWQIFPIGYAADARDRLAPLLGVGGRHSCRQGKIEDATPVASNGANRCDFVRIQFFWPGRLR
jgi:hypothetical protein